MLKGTHLISFADLTLEQVRAILDLAHQFKKQLKSNTPHPRLAGKTLAMIFEKPSTRTRVSFEVGMFQLGGSTVNLAPGDIQMDGRETVSDIARTLSRMVDGILLRVFLHQTVVRFAAASSVPIINGLSDFEHPCQTLADLQTLEERFGDLSKVSMAYVGDGNNVAHSLMFAAAKVGMTLRVVTPAGYEPLPEVMGRIHEAGSENAAKISVLNNPVEGVAGVDVIYTDVWTSMGQESESKKRLKKFKDYKITNTLLDKAAPHCLVMHCLPAHRGEEISEDVLDGSRSIVFDQAENRLHAQKAVLALLMG